MVSAANSSRRQDLVRVLISCGDYAPNLGGVPSLIDDIIRSLLAAGHHAVVLTRRWPGFQSFERADGYDIVRLDYPCLFEKASLDRQFLLRSPAILRDVARLIRKERIDTVCIGLLDTSAYYLLLLQPLLRFRLVLYLHGSDETRILPQAEPSYKYALKWALRASHAVIPVSEELAREAAEIEPAARPKMRVLPNAIDGDALRRAAPRQHPRPYIAFIGRLVKEKGVHTLIEAFSNARVEDVDLLIAGPGREERALREQAMSGTASDRIHFLGRVPRNECYSLLKSALFLVLPSEREGHPLVAIEARMAGKPVIGSRIPGIAGVVEDGRTGVLFRQGDAEELAVLIQKYCRDSSALRELTAHAGAAGSRQFEMAALLPSLFATFMGGPVSSADPALR